MLRKLSQSSYQNILEQLIVMASQHIVVEIAGLLQSFISVILYPP